MPQNLKVTRTADFTGSQVVGLNNALGLMGKGRVFYVDDNGADGYGVQSQNPNYPLLTMTAAMDLCTASVGDAIVVMAKSPSTVTGAETFPIAMDVSGVLLTGLYCRGHGGGDSGFSTDTSDGDTVSATANYINVENLFLGITTGGTQGCPITANGSYNFTVRNCCLENQAPNLALYGIEIAGDCPWLLIEDCYFGEGVGNRNTSAIIVVAATRGIIRRNVILNSSSYAIHIGSGCHGGLSILDNYIMMGADTDGMAVYCEDGSTNNLIMGNKCAFGIAAPASDPFWEAGTDEDNHFGLNWKGETACAGVA